MIRLLFRLLGSLALLAAAGAVLTAVSLLILASFLLTRPMRNLSRHQKLQATANLIDAALTLTQTVTRQSAAERGKVRQNAA